MKLHNYEVRVDWTGNAGVGTTAYESYRRDHIISAHGKPEIPGSSDPGFRGDATRYNPEELFVASLSACHMLWYLHLCATNGIVVLAYTDPAHGEMTENEDGSGEFTRELLQPRVRIAPGGDPGKAMALHDDAHRLCFLARSMRFAVDVAAKIDGP